MTDNEIIKALECHMSRTLNDCEKCPLYAQKNVFYNCRRHLCGSSLALINRQKAENSKLTSDLTSLQNDLTSLQNDLTSSKAEIERLEDLVYSADCETANVRDLYFAEKSERAKAIKEFAEKLKAKSGSSVMTCNGVEIYSTKQYNINAVTLDNLVEEMVGANNA